MQKKCRLYTTFPNLHFSLKYSRYTFCWRYSFSSERQYSGKITKLS